jgi:hypothetical protein
VTDKHTTYPGSQIWHQIQGDGNVMETKLTQSVKLQKLFATLGSSLLETEEHETQPENRNPLVTNGDIKLVMTYKIEKLYLMNTGPLVYGICKQHS